MKLLLDTHILLALGRGNLAQKYPKHRDFISEGQFEHLGSAASLWEMKIKLGLGKLGSGPINFDEMVEVIFGEC